VSDPLAFSVIARKKSGGHLQVLGQFPTKDAASDFSLGVDMAPFDDVWIETTDKKEKGLVQAAELKRDSLGLRDALFDEIDAFRKGRGDPMRAIAISKLAGQILLSAKIEHEVAKHRSNDNYDPAPMQLGRNAEEN
jgi:hypothetical protein